MENFNYKDGPNFQREALGETNNYMIQWSKILVKIRKNLTTNKPLQFLWGGTNRLCVLILSNRANITVLVTALLEIHC